MDDNKIEERLILVNRLSSLSSAQFIILVFILKPPPGILSSWLAPQRDRSNQLLDWAEGPVGPGLGMVEKWLGKVMFYSASPTVSEALEKKIKDTITYRRAVSLHEEVTIYIEKEKQQQYVGKVNGETIPPDYPRPNITENQLLASQKSLLPKQNLWSILELPDVQGRLLILGEPGSGKTTELVSLAHDLLFKVDRKECNLIPIIFELSNWKPGISIERWLILEISKRYKISRDIGHRWMDNDQIVPLLDGLNELGLRRQRKCIRAINKFLKITDYPYMVVCCRREEYERGKCILSTLNRAIYLKSLTNEQIQNYLKEMRRPSIGRIIENDLNLQTLVCQPLFLNILLKIKNREQIYSASDLLNRYISDTLSIIYSENLCKKRKISTEEILCFLAWLSKKMEKLNITALSIEDIQINWLKPKNRIAFVFIYSCICGLSFFLIFNFAIGLRYGLFFGILNSVVSGLRSEIKLAEKTFLSWRKGFFSGVIGGFLGSLIGGLNIGVISGIIIGLLNALDSASFKEKEYPSQGIQHSFLFLL